RPERDGSVLPDEDVPRRKLADLAKDRQRRWNRVEREKRLERVEVDLPTRQRAELGGKRQLSVDVTVVERLDPEAVAREDEPLPRCIPDRNGEHSAQPLRERIAVLLVEVEQDLRVAVRAKAMAGALELLSQLAVVVDLAVLDDVDRPVLVADRLVARVEVDDREAARG